MTRVETSSEVRYGVTEEHLSAEVLSDEFVEAFCDVLTERVLAEFPGVDFRAEPGEQDILVNGLERHHYDEDEGPGHDGVGCLCLPEDAQEVLAYVDVVWLDCLDEAERRVPAVAPGE